VNLSGREISSCSWCGATVDPVDGFRLAEHGGNRSAVFCRLEHIVAWAIRGPRWEPGRTLEPSVLDVVPECARCGAALDAGYLVLVRHRGEHRIPDAFCSIEHLLAWAKAGGRWRT
jgi:hypothetical protein